jgi:hypothetical protein
MRPNWIPNRTKAILASLAGVAVLSGPLVSEPSALAETADQVAAMDQDQVGAMDKGKGRYLIEPSETHPGFMLPPLSDHLNVARLDDDEAALERDDATAQTCCNEDDPQTVVLVLTPAASEAGAIGEEDDGTARQYDRGYYQEPEVIALIVVPTQSTAE